MINNFLSPKSIAIIGASDHEGKVGGMLLRKVIVSKIKVIPINPQHEELLGLKCYKSVLDFEGFIDLGIIAIPAPFVAQALEECGKKKIKQVIIISAGFSEIGNLNGEQKLKDIAKKYGLRLLGPNCFGICNPSKNLDLTFSITTPKKGNIAFISQSGALWSYISDYAFDKIGFSFFASLGDMADLSFSDFISYAAKDKDTKSIVLYVEKLVNGKKFIEECKQCNKPIFAVKVGSSDAGSAAAVSHTGSLATDYAIYKGAFKQAGITLCDSLLEAMEKASGKSFPLSIKHVKLGKNAFILTNAGGAGGLLSDYLSAKGFEMIPNLNNDMKNPWDIIGTALAVDYENALNKLKEYRFVDSIFVILTPQSMSEMEKTAEVIVNFKKTSNKKIIALFLGDKTMKEANKIFERAGVFYFNTLEEARDSVSC
jgi:acetyltransferase